MAGHEVGIAPRYIQATLLSKLEEGIIWERAMSPEEMRKIAQAIRRQNAIDIEESGPQAPYDVVGYKGVRLESRWSIIDEFARMRRIVDGFSSEDILKIAWIWCDSKAQACYTLGVNQESTMMS